MTAPDFYSFVELEPTDTLNERREEAARLLHTYGATFFRFTIVDEVYPNESYPHGFYIEGWRDQPNPQPPFDYPISGSAA